jgi:hypothetical protein
MEDAMASAFAPTETPALSATPASARASRQDSVSHPSKRTSQDLEVLSERLLSFVAESPGLRIEQINHRLGTTTRELALPIRKLTSSGRLVARGHRRSTTYHPKGSSTEASSGQEKSDPEGRPSVKNAKSAKNAKSNKKKRAIGR